MTYIVREELHTDLLQDLLRSRGFETKEEQDHFLNPDFERDSHDPFLLPDMEKSVARILQARSRHETVAVWSDYDCDGIPGGVMLVEFLRNIGCEVIHYIPHRHEEGYGLNFQGLQQLSDNGVTLVVTVDLGTTDRDPVEFANSKHIDVIVTDHHLVAGLLPEAYAVINPKRQDSLYPFDGLCGAGVAWKLIQGVLLRDRCAIGEGQEKWLLDLVGLATLSDMVPLVGENRMLARYGLMVMKRARRPGIAALLKLLRIRPETLTEDDIGFMIAPRINAASRMDAPELAAQLLASQNPVEAKDIAQKLQHLNDQRKGLVASITKEVHGRLKEINSERSVIVMGNPNWRPGVLGLVANTLVTSHGKPVFLWGREGGTVVRGSCRSDGKINVVNLMSEIKDIFEDFGGHHSSGGFSLLQDNVHTFSDRVEEAYKIISSEGTSAPVPVIEREIALSEVSRTHKTVARLAPFGQENPKPLFAFPGVSISSVKIFGKKNDHVEFSFSSGVTRIAAISFFSTPESFTKHAEIGIQTTVIGHIEYDWKGSTRIRVIDLVEGQV